MWGVEGQEVWHAFYAGYVIEAADQDLPLGTRDPTASGPSTLTCRQWLQELGHNTSSLTAASSSMLPQPVSPSVEGPSARCLALQPASPRGGGLKALRQVW